jgi:hypothetical protein
MTNFDQFCSILKFHQIPQKKSPSIQKKLQKNSNKYLIQKKVATSERPQKRPKPNLDKQNKFI